MKGWVAVTEATLEQRTADKVSLQLRIVGDTNSMFQLWNQLYEVMMASGIKVPGNPNPQIEDNPQRLLE